MAMPDPHALSLIEEGTAGDTYSKPCSAIKLAIRPWPLRQHAWGSASNTSCGRWSLRKLFNAANQKARPQPSFAAPNTFTTSAISFRGAVLAWKQSVERKVVLPTMLDCKNFSVTLPLVRLDAQITGAGSNEFGNLSRVQEVAAVKDRRFSCYKHTCLFTRCLRECDVR